MMNASAPATTAGRYGFIDAIRGIAACLVMLQHTLYQSGLLGGIPPADELHGFIPTLLELGETGVVAFFLVSGFVIPLSLEKTNNFGLFWLHRILRIYPLYWLVYAATLALLAGGTLTSFESFATNFLSHIVFAQEYIGQQNFVAGSWTLSLELVWYIGLSLLFLFSLNKKTNLIVFLAIIVSILADAACFLGHHMPMGRVSLLVCCVLGLVCYRRDKGDISDKHFKILTGLLLLMIATNLLIGFRIFPGRHNLDTIYMVGDSWILGIFVFMVPYFTRKLSLWSAPIFAFLGRISYSVYLVHGVILLALVNSPIRGYWLLGVVFSATIIIATLTYHFIEAPPIKFGHTLGQRLKAKAQAVKAPPSK